jgi:hypothetical protein
MASQPGCQGVTVFGDDADGEYGIFVLWNSKDNAAAAQVIQPKLQEFFAGNVQKTTRRPALQSLVLGESGVILPDWPLLGQC